MTAPLHRLLGFTRLGWLPVRVRGGVNRGHWWTLYPHSAYWRGDFEPEVQAAITRFGPGAGGCAWDLGAHFGFYTLALARAVGAAGAVVAVEPDRASFRRLAWHLRLNRLRHVRLLPRAASARTGREYLVQSEGSGATTSHLAYPGEAVRPDTPGTWIDTFALDDLRMEPGFRPPEFIKVDVEGHGTAALQGAHATLAQARPRLLISLHSPEETNGTAALLEPLGYRPHDLTGQRVAWAATLFRTALLLPSA